MPVKCLLSRVISNSHDGSSITSHCYPLKSTAVYCLNYRTTTTHLPSPCKSLGSCVDQNQICVALQPSPRYDRPAPLSQRHAAIAISGLTKLRKMSFNSVIGASPPRNHPRINMAAQRRLKCEERRSTCWTTRLSLHRLLFGRHRSMQRIILFGPKTVSESGFQIQIRTIPLKVTLLWHARRHAVLPWLFSANLLKKLRRISTSSGFVRWATNPTLRASSMSS